jgi:hypothetical protein
MKNRAAEAMERAPQRFWSRVQKSEGCWLWTGTILSTGYGQFTAGQAFRDMAHRYSYKLAYGEIPDGLQIDHLCRVRRCVRPSHLEAVTLQENNRRSESYSGRNARKTHCPRGHALTADNLVPRRNSRECRICARDFRRARAARLRAAMNGDGPCLEGYQARGAITQYSAPNNWNIVNYKESA